MNKLKNYIKATQQLKNDLDLKQIYKLYILIKNSFERGGKLIIAGNGGSACDAQHFATELIGRFRKEREPYNCVVLNNDITTITAWSNDYNFDDSYRRLLESCYKDNDVFLVISTSGNSKNLINAAKFAKELVVIGLLGKDGGELKNYCDESIIVPGKETSQIQEVHILIIHLLCLLLEDKGEIN